MLRPELLLSLPKRGVIVHGTSLEELCREPRSRPYNASLADLRYADYSGRGFVLHRNLNSSEIPMPAVVEALKTELAAQIERAQKRAVEKQSVPMLVVYYGSSIYYGARKGVTPPFKRSNFTFSLPVIAHITPPKDAHLITLPDVVTPPRELAERVLPEILTHLETRFMAASQT